MNTISFTSLLTHSLVSALLYSLWQGLLVYGCLFILLKALGDVSARVKYYLSLGAFTTLFIWFADTFAEQYQKLKGITVYITQQGFTQSSTITYPARTVSYDPVNYTILKQSLLGLERYSSLIIILYSIGLGVMLARFLLNVLQIRELRTKGIVEPGSHLTEIMVQWQEQLNISRPVQLLLSTRVAIPLMLGTLKPVILLPVATINNLSMDQVEAILMHELAHIKRQDFLINIFQTIAETVLFFNPFVWLISSIIRKEREHCCDDLVVAHTADPLPYARALALLESNRGAGNLSLAATGHKNLLFNRIKRIMEMKKRTVNYSQLTIIILAIIAITFSVAVYSPSFAQKSKSTKRTDNRVDGKTDSTTQKTYTYRKVTIDSNGRKKVVNKTSHTPIADDAGEEGDNVTVDISLDGDQYSKEIKRIVKDIVVASKDAASAFTSIDKEKLEKEIQKAEAEIELIDWDGIKKDINVSLAEVNSELNDPKLRREIKLEVRKSLEQAKEELERAKKEVDHKRISIAIANDGEREVRSNSNDYETMLDKMDSEGLIDRSKGFKIKKEDDELYINGERQGNTVYERYKKYLNGRSVSIKGKKGDLSISVNN